LRVSLANSLVSYSFPENGVSKTIVLTYPNKGAEEQVLFEAFTARLKIIDEIASEHVLMVMYTKLNEFDYMVASALSEGSVEAF
jgi:LmbE family N-acetylglucosaminyl deacetylase